jgi:chromosome segregation ATPase
LEEYNGKVEENLGNLTRDRDEVVNENEKYKESVQNLNSEIESLKTKLDKLTTQYNELKNQKDEERKKLDQDRIGLEKQIAEHKAREQKYEENNTNLLQEKSDLDNLKKKLAKQQEELDSQNKSESELIVELRNKLEGSEIKNITLKDVNTTLTTDLNTTKEELETANNIIMTKVNEVQTLTTENMSKDDKINGLEEKLRIALGEEKLKIALEEVKLYEVLKSTHSQVLVEFETVKTELNTVKENCVLHSERLQELESMVIDSESKIESKGKSFIHSIQAQEFIIITCICIIFVLYR